MVKSNSSQASFARWWRQVLFVPMLHSKWLTPAAKARLTEQVTLAERGHRGEVFLIIERKRYYILIKSFSTIPKGKSKA